MALQSIDGPRIPEAKIHDCEVFTDAPQTKRRT
jgi:hypothetical protein